MEASMLITDHDAAVPIIFSAVFGLGYVFFFQDSEYDQCEQLTDCIA